MASIRSLQYLFFSIPALLVEESDSNGVDRLWREDSDRPALQLHTDLRTLDLPQIWTFFITLLQGV